MTDPSDHRPHPHRPRDRHHAGSTRPRTRPGSLDETRAPRELAGTERLHDDDRGRPAPGWTLQARDARPRRDGLPEPQRLPRDRAARAHAYRTAEEAGAAPAALQATWTFESLGLDRTRHRTLGVRVRGGSRPRHPVRASRAAAPRAPRRAHRAAGFTGRGRHRATSRSAPGVRGVHGRQAWKHWWGPKGSRRAREARLASAGRSYGLGFPDGTGRGDLWGSRVPRSEAPERPW
jgi:hypothetical protein